MLTLLDDIVLALLLIFLILGGWRGFWLEAMSLLGWFIAFFAGRALSPKLVAWIPETWFHTETARFLLAFAIIFICTLILARLVSLGLTRLSRFIGLGPLNILLGMVFGLCKGVILVMIATVILGMTPIVEQPYWKASLLRPYLEQGIAQARPFFPAEFSFKKES